MATDIRLDDGDVFVAGRSPQKAQELLEKAKAVGYEGRIRTTSHGYIVPAELVDAESTVTESEEQQETPADADGTVFNPADFTVDEVIEYLDHADEGEAQRVIDAEAAASKPRKTITGYEIKGAK